MMNAPSELLYNFWYVAGPAQSVARGKTVSKTLLGHQILIGRDNAGNVFAMRDFCPHRGIPLRFGSFDGETIECCYHGWCFNTGGVCTKIPSLAPDDKTDVSRIKTTSFPCREQDGVIWVYVMAPKTRVPETLPPLPTVPGPDSKPFYWVESVTFPCDIDHAVIGLMDPSHGPFVHASWWWRTRRSIRKKSKEFEPTPLGFRMASHAPSSNSRAYKILGNGEKRTEIAFQLPGLRTEHIRVGDHHIVLLTALTPTEPGKTELHQFMFTTIGLLDKLKFLIKPFGKAFIRQDLEIVRKQQEGLKGDHPPLMLLGDADQQALWYYKIKKDYLAAAEQNIPFENRLQKKTLSWYS